jgi:starch synthase
MKILFATPEASPYFKTGGLGDVARALPDELAQRNHDVRLILPAYSVILQQGLDLEHEWDDVVPWPGAAKPVRYLRHTANGAAPVVLVKQPDFFEPGSPYNAAVGDPLATARRFAFFCRAVTRYARTWGADVIHLNDWQTGLVPVYALLEGLDAATIFTIHNLAYQGNFPPELLLHAGIPWDFYRIENGLEFYGHASFMKAGVALSDHLTTVSRNYADEIQTPAFGAGLDGLLRLRRHDLHGILNGIDFNSWHPALDRFIPAGFSAANLKPKEKNRAALLAEAGLRDGGPILAVVSRLAHQKGIDLVLAALPALLNADARLVVLGDGDSSYESALTVAAAAAKGRVATFLRFDDALARRIYAGSDFFLMPSLYEPCGLGQMIAQRYGTPPIVRRTGGLADTVDDGKTGFSFNEPTVASLMDAYTRAHTLWHGRGWLSLVRRCMRLDHSWSRSAQQYERVYGCASGRYTG